MPNSIPKIIIATCLVLVICIFGYSLYKPEAFQNSKNSSESKTATSSSKPNNTDNPNMNTQQPDLTNFKVQIDEIKIGEGAELVSGQSAEFHYTGTLTDGTKFDSSKDRNKTFTTKIGVGKVIPGWDQGIPGMKIGGVRKLTIPYQLAYGEQGIPGAIPPKADLIFEVELISIK